MGASLPALGTGFLPRVIASFDARRVVRQKGVGAGGGSRQRPRVVSRPVAWWPRTRYTSDAPCVPSRVGDDA
ncbi:hypothetical protein FCJ61_19820 [Burkholderia metallica]|uniref:hypothetical protein n=1 Tax=Burkholderia metallica TaxID=488729 RepID=UPI00157A7C05|nr:hypothetical protein [Burkholderia metallica]NTZ85190.1 hypothetical protein [Burkholderia metallica]